MRQPLIETLETRLLLSASPYQPDLLGRKFQPPPYADYTGGNIYGTDGTNETYYQTSDFLPQVYQLAVRNNGTQPDSFKITGDFGNALWTVHYYDSQVQGGLGGNDITSTVIGRRGYKTAVLQPGDMFEFRVEVGPTSGAPGNTDYLVHVHATSTNDPTNSDTILTDTSVQPTYGVQIERRNFDNSGVYFLDIKNRGNVGDKIRITGPAGGTGWNVDYFDDATGKDITSAVTSGGYVTRSLAFDHTEPLTVTLNSRSQQTVTLTAVSTTQSTAEDVVNLQNVTAPGTRPSFFPIGVFSQPTYLFSTWKSRGINTVFNYESQGGSVSIDQWTSAAVADGLYMIRQPRDNPADDINQPYLLAWSHPDELEVPTNGTYEPASTALANYQSWKSIDPNLPVLANFDGSDVIGWQSASNESNYVQYAQAADWTSSGIYPITGWDRPSDLDVSARAVDNLQNYTAGKMQFAIIECSPQVATYTPNGTPGPTPDQFRAELWDAVMHGAQGIFYFPQELPPNFQYDNTQPDVAAEMTTQDAKLTYYGAALESNIDPTSRNISVPAGFETTWRVYNGHTYYFVMNDTDSTVSGASISLQGISRKATRASVPDEGRSVKLRRGGFSDAFTPYAAHVYEV